MTQDKTHKGRASGLPNSPFLIAPEQSSKDAKEDDLADSLRDLQEITTRPTKKECRHLPNWLSPTRIV